MSLALRKVAANASKSGCTIIFLNQLRYKVGVIYGNPETTSGGQALKFYSSIRLDIRWGRVVVDSLGVGCFWLVFYGGSCVWIIIQWSAVACRAGCRLVRAAVPSCALGHAGAGAHPLCAPPPPHRPRNPPNPLPPTAQPPGPRTR